MHPSRAAAERIGGHGGDPCDSTENCSSLQERLGHVQERVERALPVELESIERAPTACLPTTLSVDARAGELEVE